MIIREASLIRFILITLPGLSLSHRLPLVCHNLVQEAHRPPCIQHETRQALSILSSLTRFKDMLTVVLQLYNKVVGPTRQVPDFETLVETKTDVEIPRPVRRKPYSPPHHKITGISGAGPTVTVTKLSNQDVGLTREEIGLPCEVQVQIKICGQRALWWQAQKQVWTSSFLPF